MPKLFDITKNCSGLYSKGRAEKIVRDAVDALHNIGIAFTYNEPVIWFEYIRDVSVRAKEKELQTVIVSNGYVNEEPLEEIISFTDAFNIDLKAFNDDFTGSLPGEPGLLEKPCQDRKIRQASGDNHSDVPATTIAKKIASQAEWIAGELGKDTPLHLSRYFPMYKRIPTQG